MGNLSHLPGISGWMADNFSQRNNLTGNLPHLSGMFGCMADQPPAAEAACNLKGPNGNGYRDFPWTLHRGILPIKLTLKGYI